MILLFQALLHQGQVLFYLHDVVFHVCQFNKTLQRGDGRPQIVGGAVNKIVELVVGDGEVGVLGFQFALRSHDLADHGSAVADSASDDDEREEKVGYKQIT